MRDRRDTRGIGDLPDSDKPTNRRTVLAGAGAVVAGAAVMHPAEGDAKEKPPEKMPVQPGDRIQFIKGAEKGTFLTAEMLEEGAKPLEAFPYDPKNEVLRRKYRLNRLLVLRLNEAEMNADTKARSAGGLLVFSALCTHRACTIKSWMAEERFLRCHCHLSRFAALNEGRVMDGPAKRQLPMVPIEIDGEGFVIAKETFTGKPGGAKK